MGPFGAHSCVLVAHVQVTFRFAFTPFALSLSLFLLSQERERERDESLTMCRVGMQFRKCEHAPSDRGYLSWFGR